MQRDLSSMPSFHSLPPDLGHEIDDFALAVGDYQAGRLEADAFKVRRVGFGIYEQRQKGTFMVRVRCTGGGILPDHLRAVASIARRHSAAPLHVTTRQELQIHGVPLDSLVAVLRDLHAAGLATRGGGGNGVRNVVVPWDAGIALGECFDVLPYATALVDRMARDSASWQLPRKYKMALVGNPQAVAEAVCTDVGFVARERAGQRGFAVYVAGGMGRIPETAKPLHEFIPAEEVYLVAEALKRVFRKYGNYTDRGKARLRFLWQSLGQDTFMSRYEEEREALRREGDWRLAAAELPPPPRGALGFPVDTSTRPDPTFAAWRRRFVTPQAQSGLFAVLVPLPCGILDIPSAEEFADFAGGLGGDVLRGTCEQNLSLRNLPAAVLPQVHALVSRLFPLSRGPRLLGACTACTGAATCALGLCRASSALAAVLDRLGSVGDLLDRCSDLRLAISGCANACGRHLLADLGFCGQIGRHQDRPYPAYSVFVGARLVTENPHFARRIAEVPARVLPEVVTTIVQAYAHSRRDGQSFADYLRDGGEAAIVALCAGQRTPPAPAEAPEYYQDWGAPEPFRTKPSAP
jgi:sulfite reductase (ferredoxin)